MQQITRTRTTKSIVAIAINVVMIAAALAAGSSTSGAKTYSDNPFKVSGVVTHADEGVNGVGAEFRIEDLADFRGGSFDDAIDEDGGVTIQVNPQTDLKKRNAQGRYAPSDFSEVLVPGQRVLVAGDWTEINDHKTLSAKFVWSPPPTNVTPRPANPEPKIPNDLSPRRVFGTIGLVSDQGTRLYHNGPWSTEFGFVMGDISYFGHEHTERVAAHHDGKLRIYYSPTTRYWVPGDSRATRAEAVKVGRVVRVTGKYSWDGLDWRLIATNVFSNPAPPDGGPLTANGILTRTKDGSEDETLGVVGTRYEGRTTGPFDGQPSGGALKLDLDWNRNGDTWEFSGRFDAHKDNSANRVAGQVSGVVFEENGVIKIEGSMLVDTANGAWNGWSGDGYLEGTVGFSGATDVPPDFIDAAFHWTLQRP